MLTRPAMLGLHLLMLVAIGAMCAAGAWQLNVYVAAHRDATATRLTATAVPLGALIGPDEALSGDAVSAPVLLRGTYARAGEQFLVAGRQEQGRAGYWVVSPLVIADVTAAGGGPTAMLVVRGWQPGDDLPPVPSGQVDVTGVLQPGDQESTGVGAGRVVSSVRIPTLVAQVPFDLYSGFVIRTDQTPPSDDGLVAVTPPAPDISWTAGVRNLGYGLQWGVFGAFAAFMWWRICADEVARHRAADPSRAPARVGSPP